MRAFLASSLRAGTISGALITHIAATANTPDIATLNAVQVDSLHVKDVDAFELPAALSVLRLADRSQRRGAQISELLGSIPGVVARERQNYAQDTQFSIRGFGARSSFGVRAVRLLQDEIPATMPDGQGQLSHFALLGAERIEVLRGPFSALHGNSSGGVLQLYSADGQRDDPWRLRSHYGSYNTLNSGLQLLGQHARMHYNLSANRFRSDGFRDHSQVERDLLNGKFSFVLAQGRQLTLLFNHLYAPEVQDPLGLTRQQYQANPRQASALARQYNTRKSLQQSQTGVLYNHPYASHSLRLMAYAGQRQVEQFQSIPASSQSNPLHGGGVIDLDNDYGGVDVRWSWQGQWLQRPLQLSAGATADQQRQYRRGYENFIGEHLGVRGALRRDQHDRVHNLDQYAQAWWQYGEHSQLLVGVRHSTLRFRSRDHYVSSSNPDDSGSRAYSATTPVAGIAWRVSDDLRLFVAAGRGLQTPTFNELGYRADGAAGLALNLAAATSNNYETGLKWRNSRGARLGLTVFRADTDNELAVASNHYGRSSYHNIGRTRRQGVELDWLQPLGSNQQLQLAYSLIDARVRQGYLTCSGSGCTSPDSWVAAGSALPGIPRQQWFSRWQWQPRQWQLASEVVAAAATVANDLGTAKAPGYALCNLELARHWYTRRGKLRLFARIDNALDRDYIGSVIVNDSNGRYYEPGPARSYSMGLQWDWQRH